MLSSSPTGVTTFASAKKSLGRDKRNANSSLQSLPYRRFYIFHSYALGNQQKVIAETMNTHLIEVESAPVDEIKRLKPVANVSKDLDRWQFYCPVVPQKGDILNFSGRHLKVNRVSISVFLETDMQPENNLPVAFVEVYPVDDDPNDVEFVSTLEYQLKDKTSAALIAKATTKQSVAPVALSSTDLSTSIDRAYLKPQGPTPFAVGVIGVIVITVGTFLLSNLLEESDYVPTVSDTTTQREPIIDPALSVDASISVAANTPVSTAPVYVEAEATVETYVSVRIDGAIVFEDVMQPGDEQLWEGESEIDIYAGNAGGLTVSMNSKPREVLGESGQLGQRVFSIE